MPFIGVDAETFYSTNFLCMVSPWMEKGTVLDFIKCCLEYLPHQDCHRLVSLLYETRLSPFSYLVPQLREVLEGLCYLHAQKVVHGDINTVNSLIVHYNSSSLIHRAQVNIFIDDEGHARLADFGLTIIGDLTANRMPTTAGQAGTVRWLPPEQLDTFDAGVGRRSTAGDVYAFGCLVVAVRVSFSLTLVWRCSDVVRCWFTGIYGPSAVRAPFVGLCGVLGSFCGKAAG